MSTSTATTVSQSPIEKLRSPIIPVSIIIGTRHEIAYLPDSRPFTLLPRKLCRLLLVPPLPHLRLEAKNLRRALVIKSSKSSRRSQDPSIGPRLLPPVA
jgi:hypothetical protein